MFQFLCIELLVVKDTTPPVISLIGDAEITIQAGTPFEDLV